MPGNHKYVNCHECKQWKVDRGRGLCYSCKRRLTENGNLDILYPSQSQLKQAREELSQPPKDKHAPKGYMMRKPGGIWVWIDDEEQQEAS